MNVTVRIKDGPLFVFRGPSISFSRLCPIIWILSPNSLAALKYTVELKNRNYYSAKIEDSKVRIYHRDDLIGSPSVSEAEFPSRKDTSRSVTLIVSTTNQTVIDAIIAEQPTSTYSPQHLVSFESRVLPPTAPFLLCLAISFVWNYHLPKSLY